LRLPALKSGDTLVTDHPVTPGFAGLCSDLSVVLA
jgi:hypothetical protein